MSDTPESDQNSIEWDRANTAGCSHEFARRLERERDEAREWIKQAAPVMESACCIAIEENIDRLDEIAGCQGLLESCPVEWERMPHLDKWRGGKVSKRDQLRAINAELLEAGDDIAEDLAAMNSTFTRSLPITDKIKRWQAIKAKEAQS